MNCFFDSKTFNSLNKKIDQITSLEMKIWDDRIIYFYSYKSDDSEEETFAYTLIEDGRFQSPISKTLSTSTGSNPFETNDNENYGVYFSENNMFIVRMAEREETEPYKLTVTIFDKELAEIHSYTCDIPKHEREGQLTFSNPYPRDNGDLYFTSTLWDEGKSKIWITDDTYHSRFHKLTRDKGIAESIEINDEQKNVKNLQVFKNTNEVITCVAYGVRDKFPLIITAEFSAAGNKVNEVLMSNDKLIFPYNYNRGVEYKKKIPINDHKILQTINTPDKGFILISEHQSEMPLGSNFGIVSYEYNCREIFVTKMNNAGEIEWVSVIDKNQKSTGCEGLNNSHAAYIESDKISFVFSDLGSNYEKDARVRQYINPNKGHLGVLAVAQVDLNNGSITQEAIFYTKDAGGLLIPKSCYADYETGYLYGFHDYSNFDPGGRLMRIKF